MIPIPEWAQKIAAYIASAMALLAFWKYSIWSAEKRGEDKAEAEQNAKIINDIGEANEAEKEVIGGDDDDAVNRLLE